MSSYKTSKKHSKATAADTVPVGKPATSGGSRTRFAALDSDSEDDRTASPPPPPTTPALLPVAPADIFADPIYLAMFKKDTLWGDLLIPTSSLAPLAPLELPPSRPVYGEEEFWTQPWAADVEGHWSHCYDTTDVSDDDWNAMMSWMYSVGWDISSASRRCVIAYPDNQPARVWVPLSRFALAAQMEEEPAHIHIGCASAPKPTPALSAPGTDKGRRKGPPRPIFCKEGKACAEAGCLYVHGDTIPVKNAPCAGPRDGEHAGDGAYCTKRNPGVGGTPCTHLHPDETWTPDMVRHRPVASN
jgi:hypothetical protein